MLRDLFLLLNLTVRLAQRRYYSNFGKEYFAVT